MARVFRILSNVSLALLVAATMATSAGASQDGSEPHIAVDTPVPGALVVPGSVVLITGWALDANAEGPGIDEVHIYLGAAPEDGGVPLGIANYGLPRPDVADTFGRPDWLDVGYEFNWFVQELPPGGHTLFIVAHLTQDDSWASEATSIAVPASAGPAPGPSASPGAAPTPAPLPPPGPLRGPPSGLIPGPGPGSSPPILPPPGATLHVVTTADPNGLVHLSWLPLEFASSYRIYISVSGAPTGFTVLRTINQGLGSVASSTTIDRLAPGAIYAFQVRAVDASGDEIRVPASAGIGVGFNPTLTATVSSLGNVRIAWPPVPQAISYRIYRSASSGAPGSFVVATTVNQNIGSLNLETTITGLVPGETYELQVRAVDSSGRETPVPGASFVGLDPFFPPANLAIGGLGATQVSLSWLSSPTPRVTAHRVYIAPAGSTAFTAATLTNVTRNSATVIGLIPNTSYSFYVVAIDIDDRESGPSNIVTMTPRLP